MGFSPCQEEALSLLQRGGNVFLTGGAGTGKSFLVREFLRRQNAKTFPVLASTGAAAVLVGGRTFHSFFGLGIMEGGLEETVRKALRNSRVLNRLKKIEGFVLDEISMIHREAFTAAETITRMARDSEEPWGGVRVIAVGDFAQLPPVSRNRFERGWAFDCSAWQRTYFEFQELKTIMRTEDADYISVLNQIRQGQVNLQVREFLDERLSLATEDFTGTRLFPRRAQADAYNLNRLREVEGEEKSYETVYSGAERFVTQLKKSSPVPEVIHLKKDCLVMLRQNDPKQRWVNGSLAHVRDFLDSSLLLELFNGRLIELETSTFSLLDADGKTVAAAENYPVNLAYASTIHKAQGATFDRLMVNLQNLWEPGQAYVALSRVTTAQGLSVEGWSERSIHSDPHVQNFYRDLSH